MPLETVAETEAVAPAPDSRRSWDAWSSNAVWSVRTNSSVFTTIAKTIQKEVWRTHFFAPDS